MSKKTFAAALAGAIALSACTEPGALTSPDNPNANRNRGAAIGAASGAVLGALVSSSDDRARGALTGAVVGGALGAGIGYNLDQQEADLRRDLGNDNVTINNTGDRLIVTLPQDILFATDSAQVRSDLRRDLATVANNLQAYPNSTIQVVGHTDSDGEAAYNQQLSERRAGAVADILRANGVAANRVQAFGRGESQPIASNLTPDGKAQNRRVEIVILPNPA